MAMVLTTCTGFLPVTRDDVDRQLPNRSEQLLPPIDYVHSKYSHIWASLWTAKLAIGTGVRGRLQDL